MDVITPTSWMPADYCMSTATKTPDKAFAENVYACVCRTDFTSPGFCLIDLGTDASSEFMRHFMVSLKRSLQQIHQSCTDRDLVYLSAARFDQQETTKPHRDGGPDECFLMLGYEPSEVLAEVVMSDYSKCAYDKGMTPAELLAKHNPMFSSGKELLQPYSTLVLCFSKQKSQILLINNSIAPLSEDSTTWQGVLHTATIPHPSDDLRRVINSTMIASVPMSSEELVSITEQEEFINTNIIRRRGYDKPHLKDDI